MKRFSELRCCSRATTVQTVCGLRFVVVGQSGRGSAPLARNGLPVAAKG